MTTTSRNGAAEITETQRAASPGRAAGKVESGKEAGVRGQGTGDRAQASERNDEKKGFSLFGDGPQSQEALSKRLESFLKDEPDGASAAGNAGGTPAGAGGTPAPPGDESDEADTHESAEIEEAPGANGEPGEEGEEGSAGASPHQEEEEADAAEPKDWPKAAVREVSKLRKERREAREAADSARSEIEALRGRLESVELKRPVAPTKENPLSFATDEKALDEWEQNAGEMVGMLEDALEAGPEEAPAAKVVRWARANGAWNEEAEALDRGALRGLLRDARRALTKDAPARRQFLAEQRKWDGQVAQDPVLGSVWKDKGSQEYRDAMGVIESVPGLRGLAHARAAAAIYALGLREYRRQVGAKQGAGSRGQEAGDRGQGAGTLPHGRGSVGKPVKGPGRTVVLPRNPPAQAVEEAAIAERVRKPGATAKDFEAYVERQLAGKVPR